MPYTRPALCPIVPCLLACHADVAVLSVSEPEVVGRDPRIAGRDGGPSALAWGQTVWTYGDTVLAAPDAEGTNWHTNSWEAADPVAWKTDLLGPVDTTGAPRFIIPLSDEEKAWDIAHAAEDCEVEPCSSRWALWPSQPLLQDGDGPAWLLYGLYNDHHDSGIGIASWAGLEQPVVRHRVDGSWLLFPQPELEWANAPVVHEGHLWTFACPLDFVARPCSLARVPFESADQRDAWTFWNGRRFVADAEDRVTLFDGAPIMAVSFVQAVERWLVVYAPPFSGTIVARTAPELAGPWSAELLLLRTDDEPYDASHHAELAESDGLVQYVTWSRAVGDGWFDREHVFVRIEFGAR